MDITIGNAENRIVTNRPNHLPGSHIQRIETLHDMCFHRIVTLRRYPSYEKAQMLSTLFAFLKGCKISWQKNSLRTRTKISSRTGTRTISPRTRTRTTNRRTKTRISRKTAGTAIPTITTKTSKVVFLLISNVQLPFTRL